MRVGFGGGSGMKILGIGSTELMIIAAVVVIVVVVVLLVKKKR